MKCRRCNGALCNINDSAYCLDCNDRSQILNSKKIIEAEEIFQAAQTAFKLGKPFEALSKLKECLHIRRAVLYKYNESIIQTLQLMGEIYETIGLYKYITCNAILILS